MVFCHLDRKVQSTYIFWKTGVFTFSTCPRWCTVSHHSFPVSGRSSHHCIQIRKCPPPPFSNKDFIVLPMQKGGELWFIHSNSSFCKLAAILTYLLFFYPLCVAMVSHVLCMAHELSSMLVGICAKLQSFKHSCWTFASFYYWLHAENDSSRQSTYHNLSLIHTFLY